MIFSHPRNLQKYHVRELNLSTIRENIMSTKSSCPTVTRTICHLKIRLNKIIEINNITHYTVREKILSAK